MAAVTDNATMHKLGGLRSLTARTIALATMVAVAVAACSAAVAPSASPSAAANVPPVCTRTASTPTAPSPERPAVVTASAEAVAALSLTLSPVIEGLETPVQIVEVPGDAGLRAIVERSGSVRLLDGDTIVRDRFIDLRDQVAFAGEQGLLSIAFHPDYDDNGRVFVYYSNLDGDGLIVEYARTIDPFRTDPASCLILRVEQPTPDHNGGLITFGPDGYLYAGFGDGSPGGDPNGLGQRMDTHLSKLLRLDVDAAGAYGVPATNPFVDDPSAMPEILALGLRNPWRYSFDAATDDLWIGDVGQARFEEVNVMPAGTSGANFGWSRMEGDRCYRTTCDTAEYTLPVSTYEHEPDCAIVGGYVYRGSAIPDLAGWYVFGDFCSGTIRAIDAAAARAPDAGLQEPVILLDSDAVSVSFGEDRDGELYVVDLAGTVWRLTEAP